MIKSRWAPGLIGYVIIILKHSFRVVKEKTIVVAVLAQLSPLLSDGLLLRIEYTD